jgi:hypothetical protein
MAYPSTHSAAHSRATRNEASLRGVTMPAVKQSIATLSFGITLALAATTAGAQNRQAGSAAGPPSTLRSVPAETTAAAVVSKGWKAPRTSWGAPSLEGVWSTDDMRSIPTARPDNFGTRETLTPEEFKERAARDEGGRDQAANKETFLRNEWGIRSFGYSSLVVDPPNGKIPEMTAAGKARAAGRDRGTFGTGPFDSFEDFTLYDRCITRGVLGSTLPVIYGNGLRITQNPTAVAITYEMIHDTRVIPIDGRAHLDSGVEQYLGNARGHWQGDTLVVETTNFTDKTSIGANGNGTRHSDRLKLTETFKRVDPEMIEYTATVVDPVTYTAPFKFRLMITKQPNYETYEYSCHEGNGAVGHALSGERAYEKQVAEAVAKGLPPPKRSTGLDVYGRPKEGSEIFNINAGE